MFTGSRNTQQIVAPECNADCGRLKVGMTKQANEACSGRRIWVIRAEEREGGGRGRRRGTCEGHVTGVMEEKRCKLGLERGHVET